MHRQEKNMVKLAVDVDGLRWPGFRARLVIVLVIVLVTSHWDPNGTPLLGLGTCLGTWLLVWPTPAGAHARELR
jgi:hypothetical protein